MRRCWPTRKSRRFTIPLPNHLHVPLTLAAAKAGKHVLCEKPIAITAKEAAKLRKIPKGIYVAEAFMVRHSLQWLAARAHAKKGDIGDVRAVQVYFTYFNRDPKNVRNMADIGGGGLYDIGCYPITVSRFMFGAEPKRVIATFDWDPKFKTDRMAGGLADFGDGRHLTFTISTQLAPWQRAQIGGTKGRIEVEIPFNAPPDKPNRYFVQGMQMNEGTWHRTARLRPVPVAGRSLRPRHPQGRKSRLGRRRRHPEHENHRRLLPLRKKRQMGEALSKPPCRFRQKLS